MIDGKVAGLTMGTAAPGDPNAGSSLQVRGMASVNGGTGPLIVVDGVPGRDLNSIPKDEIESITVLKDGASSAIYGARGANGVVNVTTKTGRGGDMSISYDGHVAFNSVVNKPEALSAEERVAHGRSTTFDPSDANNLPHSYNFYDMLLNDGSAENYHNLALEGGTVESNYRLSNIVRDSEGIDIVSGRRDYGGRLNFNHSFIEHFNILGNLYVNKSSRHYTNYEAFNQAIKVRPTEQLYDDEGLNYRLFSGHQYYNPLALMEYNPDQGERVGLSGDITFRADLMTNLTTSLMIAENYRENKRYRYNSSLSRVSRDNQYSGRAQINNSNSSERVLEWTVNYMHEYNNHSAEVLGGYSYQDFRSADMMTNLTTSLMIAENYRENKRYRYNSSLSRVSRDNQYSGRAQINNSNSSERVLEWTVNYMHEYNNHSAEVLGGYSYQDFTSESIGLWNADFASDGLLWNNLGGGSFHSTSGGQVAPSSGKSSSKLIGFFGRINYNYDRTYLISASLDRTT